MSGHRSASDRREKEAGAGTAEASERSRPRLAWINIPAAASTTNVAASRRSGAP
jgi:hypothetical protein